MIPTLHIHLLGDFMLVSGDTPVTTVTIPRLQSLLAYLLLHRTAPQDRSHLAFLLWPDSTEAQAHTNLRKLLYQLRQSLPNADQFLYADKQSLQWLSALPVTEEVGSTARETDSAVATWTLDILEVERALAQAAQEEQAQDISATRQALEQVMQLYRGDLLPSCYDEWILPERDHWHLLFLSAAERLIALLEQERNYEAAIPIAQQLLRHDPLHEAIYRQLMRLYALRGERAASMHVYHSCVTVLERELGTEPSVVTRAVYESLVQSDTIPETITPRGIAAPLLGRKAEWRQLQEAWRKATEGIAVPLTKSPHLVLLTGEAGIGKTRLAEEMEAWVSRQGMITVSARCYAAVGELAYAPVTTWLRTNALQTGLSALDAVSLTEIARLVPEVLVTRSKLPRPAAMTEGWQRHPFFEALARAVLCTRQPLLLLLDDLQWCDHETLEWLQYLLRLESGARVLLIGTVRTEEILPGHPLVGFLGALQRDGLVIEIPLGPLTTKETTSLAEHILSRQLDSAMSSTLFAETEGNPLFVVEMARAGALGLNGGRAATEDKSSRSLLMQVESSLPPTVQSVLATRLNQLSPLAHEVANVAAVIGREFVFSVLVQASGQSEDAVVRGLDELWQRRLVREQGTGIAEVYDFSHDKIREQVYLSLSPASRRLLHRRSAAAFEEVYASNLDVVSGQLAAHFERAGLPVQAILYYQRAGKVAMDIYANAEAMNAFERAAALLETSPAGHTQGGQSWKTAVQVYESQGDIFGVTGYLQEARQAYQRARSTLPPQESVWQARLQRKMASTWNHASANPHDSFPINAQQAFKEAERILADAAEQANPAWQHEWIDLQFAQIWPLRGSEDDMTAMIEKVRCAIEQYGTREQRELLSYAIATRDLIRVRYVISEQRIAVLRQVVTAVQQTGNKSKLGILHMTFGITLLWSGHLDEAEEQLGKALHVAEQLGLAWLQIRCLTFLPFIARKRGQVEQVRGLLAHALAKSEGRKNSILTGHRAWVAWRDGNLGEAAAYGRTSLEESQAERDVNLFRWVGVWPLLGVALMQEQRAEVIRYVRMVLEPTQQLPPDQLSALLEGVLQAWNADELEEVRTLLQQVVPLAEKMGFL